MARLSFLLLFLSVASTSAARACPNPLERQRMTSRIVEAAEQALAEGRYRRSYALTDAPSADDPGLYRRALVVHLVSALRRGYETWVPDNRSASKAILPTLRKLAAEVPDDPWLRARLAEALASSHEAEAKAMLEELAGRDLLPDPSAWGALAQLRERAGDTTGATGAAGRCRAAARAPIVCTPLHFGPR